MAIGSPPYYMGPKHTGELWVYIGTPLPNPSGNTGVMVCLSPLNMMLCYQTKIGTTTCKPYKHLFCEVIEAATRNMIGSTTTVSTYALKTFT